MIKVDQLQSELRRANLLPTRQCMSGCGLKYSNPKLSLLFVFSWIHPRWR